MAIYKVAGSGSAAPGFAGPPNAKSAEALSKYIITDMYAKAVQGKPAEDAVGKAAVRSSLKIALTVRAAARWLPLPAHPARTSNRLADRSGDGPRRQRVPEHRGP